MAQGRCLPDPAARQHEGGCLGSDMLLLVSALLPHLASLSIPVILKSNKPQDYVICPVLCSRGLMCWIKAMHTSDGMHPQVDEFELPLAIKGELRAYQRAGISWLAFLRRCGLHGVLADEMGLGKTLQATAIIVCESHHFLQAMFWIKHPTVCQADQHMLECKDTNRPNTGVLG